MLRFIKSLLSDSQLQLAKNIRTAIQCGDHPAIPAPVPLASSPPWSSPNIWQIVVDASDARAPCDIFEYGAGASSVQHIKRLLQTGGSHTCVEHDGPWYDHVVATVVELLTAERLEFRYAHERVGLSESSVEGGYDSEIELVTRSGQACAITLKLRPGHNCQDEADGTPEEYFDYVRALEEPADIVLIDGRARKSCVSWVLDQDLLKPRGLLALFEAGRGVEGWLGMDRLTGTADYQPEVQRMLDLGGELVDGDGLERWPKPAVLRHDTVNAESYPLEACFWTRTE